MESLQVAIQEEGPLKKKLTITVPQDQVKATYDKVYNGLKNKVRIKGFRPGKMPQTLMEKRFEKYMAEEAMENLVPQYYQKAIAQEKLTPAMQPAFADLQIDKQKPLVFTATVEVWPQVDLVPYNQLKLAKKEVSISDEELQTQINHHLERRAAYAVKEGAAADGDRVSLSFEAKTEDQTDVSQPRHDYVLGSKQFIPEFELALTGMKAGEDKSFEAVLPADHPREEFRNKKAFFKVHVQQVETRSLPAIDEHFLQQYKGRAATKEEFEAMCREEVNQIKTERIKAEYRAELRQELALQLNFEIPASLLASEIEYQKEQLGKKGDIAAPDLEQKAQKAAQEGLRLSRYIYVVKEKEEIQIDPNQAYSRFAMNAQMLGMDPSQLLQSDYGRQFYEDTYHMVTEEAVLDFIADKVLA